MQLLNKHVVLGVTGGIAAYKSAQLVRCLQQEGAQVRVVMTKAARAFITPLTFQALTGSPVFEHSFHADSTNGMAHIDLARWADVILVAPAVAAFIARLAYGHADDLLNTLCLATQAQIVLAPAMNQQMWQNSMTQENIARLLAQEVKMLGPASGEQACGELGPGRMLQPEEITQRLINLFQPGCLSTKCVLITAGPTHEALDPVRFISNHSTGKMGYALASAAAQAGAKVKLISGPTQLSCPQGVEKVDVQTALEMRDAVMADIHSYDIFIACAAVSDFRSAEVAPHKIKRGSNELILHLIPNPDILTEVAQLAHRPITIGFAAETQHVLTNAQEKLVRKGIDMIIANQVGSALRGFAADTNEVTVITATQQYPIGLAPKIQIAKKLIEIIGQYIQEKEQENGKKVNST